MYQVVHKIQFVFNIDIQIAYGIYVCSIGISVFVDEFIYPPSIEDEVPSAPEEDSEKLDVI